MADHQTEPPTDEEPQQPVRTKPLAELTAKTLARRILVARSFARLSQGGLAGKIGVTRGAVGQWETETTQPSDANLRLIAVHTNSSYEWLATGRGERRPAPAFISEPILFAGTVEAGVFRLIELEKKETLRMSLRPLIRYGTMQQYAWKVCDDSMELVGIHDGMHLIAAKADDFRVNYGPIKEKSIVIVQRLREDGTERELSVKEYARPRGDYFMPRVDQIELRPRSNNKAYKSYTIPVAVAEGSEIAASSDIQIVGVVLAAIRLFNP
jgi:transcriptional regulator with XRE-family HTH domain